LQKQRFPIRQMKIDPKNFPLLYFIGGVIKNMNNNPNSPTRSKLAFSDENDGDDFSKVVILPRALFWFLVGLPILAGSTLFWVYTQYEELKNPDLPRVIQVDGGCTIEAKAITLKGTATTYRLVPVDALPETR
jgi:hypothetical protein